MQIHSKFLFIILTTTTSIHSMDLKQPAPSVAAALESLIPTSIYIPWMIRKFNLFNYHVCEAEYNKKTAVRSTPTDHHYRDLIQDEPITRQYNDHYHTQIPYHTPLQDPLPALHESELLAPYLMRNAVLNNPTFNTNNITLNVITPSSARSLQQSKQESKDSARTAAHQKSTRLHKILQQASPADDAQSSVSPSIGRKKRGRVHNVTPDTMKRCTYEGCTKAFTTEPLLKRHWRQVHEGQPKTPPQETPSSTDLPNNTQSNDALTAVSTTPAEINRPSKRLKTTHQWINQSTAPSSATQHARESGSHAQFNTLHEGLLPQLRDQKNPENSDHTQNIANQDNGRQKKSILCKTCLKLIGTTYFTLHSEWCKKPRGKFSCQDCTADFLDEQKLQDHVQTYHQQNSNMCYICAKNFARTTALIDHQLKKHLSSQ